MQGQPRVTPFTVYRVMHTFEFLPRQVSENLSVSGRCCPAGCCHLSKSPESPVPIYNRNARRLTFGAERDVKWRRLAPIVEVTA